MYTRVEVIPVIYCILKYSTEHPYTHLVQSLVGKNPCVGSHVWGLIQTRSVYCKGHYSAVQYNTLLYCISP